VVARVVVDANGARTSIGRFHRFVFPLHAVYAESFQGKYVFEVFALEKRLLIVASDETDVVLELEPPPPPPHADSKAIEIREDVKRVLVDLNIVKKDGFLNAIVPNYLFLTNEANIYSTRFCRF
jgi:hypothetical protein